MKRTKIIATLGPASSSMEVIEGMIHAGANVCRINFSHGTYDDMQKLIDTIKAINKKLGAHVAILADLQGPKLRIGTVENNSIDLIAGNEIIITTKECVGTTERLYITYPQFPKDVKAGESILIDDGKLLLKVIETNGLDEVKAVISHGGILSSKKGVNLPNTKISLPCLTEKDLKDLDFALSQKVDWIGLSFVRSASDIIELKELIRKYSPDIHTKVVAKIEKPEAIGEIDAIIYETDAIMVARGDLGVEVPMQEVPVIQKMIVRKCLEKSKPVIIATQMMESMITNISPSRAEVNDVANSVMDGADAVMLSGETSVGIHPVKVVEAMTKIIQHVEATHNIYDRDNAIPEIDFDDVRYISDSICYAAAKMTQLTKASAVVTMTHSGYTAFKLSSHRPRAKIFVFTDNHKILTTLSLVWGVIGFYYDKSVSTDDTIIEIRNLLKVKGLLHKGELLINIASIPLREKGKTNMLKLSAVE